MPKKKKKEYEVDSIVEQRSRKGKKEVKVHWKGYSSLEDTWEPLSNLKDTEAYYQFQKRKEKRKNKRKRKEKEVQLRKKMKSSPQKWVVNKILSHKKGKREMKYRVEWQGGEKTWEPYRNLKHLDLMKEYKKNEAVLEKAEEAKKKEQEEEKADEEEPKQKDAEEHFEVQKITNEQFDEEEKIMYYKVRWKGYKASDDTWEPESGVKHTYAWVDWIKKKAGRRRSKRGKDK